MQLKADNGVFTMSLDERFDAQVVDQAREIMSPALAQSDARLLIDLSSTRVVDSTGLGFLVGILKTLRVGEGDLALAGLNPQVKALLALTRLDQVFRIVDRPSDAFA